VRIDVTFPQFMTYVEVELVEPERRRVRLTFTDPIRDAQRMWDALDGPEGPDWREAAARMLEKARGVPGELYAFVPEAHAGDARERIYRVIFGRKKIVRKSMDKQAGA